jgi:rod shape-determining protein MreD
MRAIHFALLLLSLLLLQTVVVPRLAFLGVTPDLILVAVIIFAVLGKKEEAMIFAALAACGQDLLGRGWFLETVLKVTLTAVIANFRAEFGGDEYNLAAGLVALITPLYLLLELGVPLLLYGRGVDPRFVLLQLIAGTIYNLLMVPLLYPLVRRLVNADQ